MSDAENSSSPNAGALKLEPAQTRAQSHSMLVAVAYLLGLLIIGTTGFYYIEDMSVLDSLYMTVITITTVGFGEVQPLHPAGRIFAMLMILGGAGFVAYTLTTSVNYLVTGEWQANMARRRKQRMLDQLNRHTIVCGYGRVGRYVVNELRREGLPYVIIETDPTKAKHLEQGGHLCIQGNAANETVLQRAGIERAHNLIAAVNSDAENVFIVLTARSMNSDLYIVARANFEETEKKLIRAGANRALTPYVLSGRRMVSLLVRPEVADFLDEVMHSEDLELFLEQFVIGPDSPLVGKTIAQAHPSSQHGVVLLACTDPQTGKRIRPVAETIFEIGMRLIVIGTEDKLLGFCNIACDYSHAKRFTSFGRREGKV